MQKSPFDYERRFIPSSWLFQAGFTTLLLLSFCAGCLLWGDEKLVYAPPVHVDYLNGDLLPGEAVAGLGNTAEIAHNKAANGL